VVYHSYSGSRHATVSIASVAGGVQTLDECLACVCAVGRAPTEAITSLPLSV
jgi:hypothetical protein